MGMSADIGAEVVTQQIFVLTGRGEKMQEMYKDNIGNWHYGNKGEKLSDISYATNSVKPVSDSIPIDWLLNRLLEEDLLETHHLICCLWERWKEENENE